VTWSLVAGVVAAFCWVALLLLPSRPYSTRERIEPAAAPDYEADLSSVAVIIPARNEAGHIHAAIAALARQGAGLEVIVVDDQSTDATAAVAGAAAAPFAGSLHSQMIAGSELPPGWGGKLWALEQGFERVRREWVLLLDADIEIMPGVIAALLKTARETDSSLVSVMATLRCESFWERLLVPPFVYFFKLIYPFARVATPGSGVAAAAGGCILVRASALREVAAFGSLRDALIDDCTLAAALKQAGHRLWLGLSKSVQSRRRYEHPGVFSHMIARTAFTQLRYSTVLLLLVSVTMLIVFAGPLVALWNHSGMLSVSIAMTGLFAMCAGYRPLTKWYSLPLVWTLTLPLAAVLYLGMTWQSAFAYWRGTRAQWKDRAYVSR